GGTRLGREGRALFTRDRISDLLIDVGAADGDLRRARGIERGLITNLRGPIAAARRHLRTAQLVADRWRLDGQHSLRNHRDSPITVVLRRWLSLAQARSRLRSRRLGLC